MRKYQAELKVYLRDILLTYRQTLGLTQEQMASRLRMTPRSYSDLERGKTGFSAVSLIFLLYNFPADKMFQIIQVFVASVRETELKEAG